MLMPSKLLSSRTRTGKGENFFLGQTGFPRQAIERGQHAIQFALRRTTKPDYGHPEATLRQSGSQPVGTPKPPSGYPEDTRLLGGLAVTAAKTHLNPKNRWQAPAFGGALTKRHSITGVQDHWRLKMGKGRWQMFPGHVPAASPRPGLASDCWLLASCCRHSEAVLLAI